MQKEIRLTPILLVVLGVTTVLMVGMILLLWEALPPNLQSGLPFAISTVVLVNTVMLRVIPSLGKRLAEDDPAAAQKRAFVNAPPLHSTPAAPVAWPSPAFPATPPTATPTQACLHCGRIAQAGDAFCRSCGHSLTGVGSLAPAPTAVYSVAPPPPMAAPAGSGPLTSVGGTVAVSQRVHVFLSKRALRYLLFIGTALNIVAIMIYLLIGFIVNACSSGTNDVTACAPHTADYLNALLILALIIWLPGIVLVLLADVFALIRVALVRRWGWFAAILLTYFFFWNIAMFLYVFVGPDAPPARQLPVAARLPY